MGLRIRRHTACHLESRSCCSLWGRSLHRRASSFWHRTTSLERMDFRTGLGHVGMACPAMGAGSRGHWSGLGCIGSSCGTDHWLDAGLVELRKVSGLNPIHQGPVGASSETPLLTSRRPIGPLPRRGRGGVPKTPEC